MVHQGVLPLTHAQLWSRLADLKHPRPFWRRSWCVFGDNLGCSQLFSFWLFVDMLGIVIYMYSRDPFEYLF